MLENIINGAKWIASSMKKIAKEVDYGIFYLNSFRVDPKIAFGGLAAFGTASCGDEAVLVDIRDPIDDDTATSGGWPSEDDDGGLGTAVESFELTGKIYSTGWPDFPAWNSIVETDLDTAEVREFVIDWGTNSIIDELSPSGRYVLFAKTDGTSRSGDRWHPMSADIYDLQNDEEITLINLFPRECVVEQPLSFFPDGEVGYVERCGSNFYIKKQRIGEDESLAEVLYTTSRSDEERFDGLVISENGQHFATYRAREFPTALNDADNPGQIEVLDSEFNTLAIIGDENTFVLDWCQNNLYYTNGSTILAFDTDSLDINEVYSGTYPPELSEAYPAPYIFGLVLNGSCEYGVLNSFTENVTDQNLQLLNVGTSTIEPMYVSVRSALFGWKE